MVANTRLTLVDTPHKEAARPSIDDYFVALLPVIKSRASCSRRQVGAVLVDSDNNIISTGYNGPPRGISNCTLQPCQGANDPSGDTTRCIALHAEHNAIFYAGDRIRYAHTIYTTAEPCFKCALEILQTPIKKIIYLESYLNTGSGLLRSRGVELIHYAGIK